MPGTGFKVVLLGRRAPAIAAARSAGADVVVVAPRLSRRLREAPGVDWVEADPEEVATEELADLPAVRGAEVVLAAAEGMVAPAARLRRELEIAGLTPVVAARCTDKALMKVAIQEAGIPCARWVTADDELGGAALVERLGLPFVLKDRVGSGGRGTRVVREAAEVPDTLAPERMAEAYVRGVEMSVESLVHDGEVVWANVTAYIEPRAINLLPSPPPDRDGVRALQRLVQQAITALGVDRGLTHTEVYRTEAGFMFGELAARPPGGYIMPAIERAYGFDPWRAWLEVERGAVPAVNRAAIRAAAVQVLHPGAGEVIEAGGLERVRAMAGVDEAVLRVRPGDRLPPRLGAGQEAGHLLVVGATPRQALARLRSAAEGIRLRVDGRAH